MIPTIDSSPLLRRMHEALVQHGRAGYRLRVSVADEAKWEKSNRGDEVLVRWVCWSIEDGDREVTAPVFEVVGPNVTTELLRLELPKVFSGVEVEVVVDNDIDV